MYGTVAKMKVKPGRMQDLKRFSDTESNRGMKGYRGIAVYQMDSDPNEVYLAVMFEDKSSYVANAESPEQDQRFREMMKYLESEPEWHDGEIIFADQA